MRDVYYPIKGQGVKGEQLGGYSGGVLKEMSILVVPNWTKVQSRVFFL